jgi:hypothetical protein
VLEIERIGIPPKANPTPKKTKKCQKKPKKFGPKANRGRFRQASDHFSLTNNV